MGIKGLMNQFNKSSAEKRAEQEVKQKPQSTTVNKQATQTKTVVNTNKNNLAGKKFLNGHLINDQGQYIDENGNLIEVLDESKGIVELQRKYNNKVPRKLTNKEIGTIMYYWSRAGYGEINNYSQTHDRQVKRQLDQTKPYIGYAVRLLQKATTQQMYNREKFTLYRGEKLHCLLDRIGLEYNDYTINNLGNLLTGKLLDVYYNKFLATTSKINIAKAFADEEEYDSQWGRSLVWVLDASHGIKAMRAEVGGQAAYSGEDEYILPLGGYLKVTGVKYDKTWNYVYIYAKIVNQQADSSVLN